MFDDEDDDEDLDASAPLGEYVGGPWDGKDVEVKEGWPPPHAIRHASLRVGWWYVRRPNGDYHWEEK